MDEPHLKTTEEMRTVQNGATSWLSKSSAVTLFNAILCSAVQTLPELPVALYRN